MAEDREDRRSRAARKALEKQRRKAEKAEEKWQKQQEKAEEKRHREEEKIEARRRKREAKEAAKKGKKNTKQNAPKRADVRKAAQKTRTKEGVEVKKKQSAKQEKEKRLSAQRTIAYQEMSRDGICRVKDRVYSKTIRFYDINYQLAQNEDKNAIFENWCDFLNYFDSTISFQLSFINHKSNMAEFEKIIRIKRRGLVESEKMSRNAETPEPEPKITFYVAECMELPVLGEYHSDIATAEEAVKLYETIPADRMNGIKGIGFDLQDGSIYDGEYPLMHLGVIDLDEVNHIEHYRNSPLVQAAIKDLSQSMEVTLRQTPAIEQEEKMPPASQHVQETETLTQAEEQKAASETAEKPLKQERTNRKRESVLKALRERQNKLKEQEKSGEKQHEKFKDHKKGDIDL